MRTIAVTGATGKAGQFILKELLKHDVLIKAWRRKDSLLPINSPKIAWQVGELGNRWQAYKLLEGVDHVIHAAFMHVPGRYRGGEGANLNHFLEVNLMGSLQLMEIAFEKKIKSFIFLSSRAVYGDQDNSETLLEDMSCRPSSHYGALKRAIEAFIQSYGLGEHWPIISIRATGIYGIVSPFEESKWVNFISSVLHGKPLIETEEGTQVHGADLAKAIWLLIENAQKYPGELFNCSDLFVDRQKILNTIIKLKPVTQTFPPPKQKHLRVMNCDKLKALNFHFGGESLFQQTIHSIIMNLDNSPQKIKRGS